MKHVRGLILTLVILGTVQVADAQHRPYGPDRTFGIGLIIGEPTGISAKLWTSGTTAFDAGIGWSLGADRIDKYSGAYVGGDRVHLHVDHLWHAMNAIQETERFPVYYGIGGRLNSGGGWRSSFAVRGVIGIAWLPRSVPMDVFLELAPSLELTPATGFGIDLGLGARYFF